MSGRLIVNEQQVLGLGRGVRMRFDSARDCWTLMAPERVVVLDEISYEVLHECIGSTGTIGQVINQLAEQFDAPRQEIAADVIELLQGFADKKMLIGREYD